MLRKPRLDQLDLFRVAESVPPVPRWSLTRPMAASRLRDSAVRKLEFVRSHYPELDAITVRVGRTQSRRAHAWASLDPAAPAVWIKPGALTRFTIAHEFTHLLQARNLVPRGEKTADLYALARHPDLVDKRPSYLKVPRILFSLDGTPRHGVPRLLHDTAVAAIRDADGKPRRAIRLFEGSLAVAALPAALRALLGAAGFRP